METPPQVLNVVVRFVSVDVINTFAIARVIQKCFCDQPVDSFMPPHLVTVNVQARIPSTINATYQNAHLGLAQDKPLVAYGIPRITFNALPVSAIT